jgi:hypothetical protein
MALLGYSTYKFRRRSVLIAPLTEIHEREMMAERSKSGIACEKLVD